MDRDWAGHAARGEARYADGCARLPEEPDARQKQLVRTANAALAVGLASLMDGRRDAAERWCLRAAELSRQSYAGAPAGSWGRLIGALKMRLVAGDAAGAERDARWALDQEPDPSESPIGWYAACLAHLVLGEDAAAASLAARLRAAGADRFPGDVAAALLGLATADRSAYEEALGSVLRSFETRDAYLEDVPIADTVLVLDLLAAARGMAVEPRSALLPAA
jgi:hypothetical protein